MEKTYGFMLDFFTDGILSSEKAEEKESANSSRGYFVNRQNVEAGVGRRNNNQGEAEAPGSFEGRRAWSHERITRAGEPPDRAARAAQVAYERSAFRSAEPIGGRLPGRRRRDLGVRP